MTGTGGQGTKTDTGKNKDIIGLTDPVRCSLVYDIRKWRTGTHQSPPLRPAVQICRHSLGMIRGIGERHDNRTICMVKHCADNVPAETTCLTGGPDEYGNTGFFDHLLQLQIFFICKPCKRCRIFGKFLFVGKQVTVCGDKPSGIQSENPGQGFFIAHPILTECGLDLFGNTNTTGTGTMDQVYLIGQFFPFDLHGSNNAGKRYCTSTLDIIVK